ncbi:MAG TPA: hypothetical protein VFP05_16155, partial [Thermomicrobiales bacterium]|nr:hypothetical protein [Thermomicrobiales bacterium]
GEAPATEVPAPPTVTEVPLADFAYYESPNWGYIFSWDTNKWSVTDESSENGVDRLLIAGSEGSVELLGGQAYSGDPATCLTTAEQSIWTEPDVMNVQGATDGTYDFAYSDDWNAGNTFQIDYTDGQAQLWKIDCYQLAPGAEVLRITVVGSFEQFDLYWNDLVNISTDVAFPRRSFTGIDASDGYLTGAGTGCPSQPYPPRPLRDGAGFEVGMVTWYRWADLNSRPLAVLILENTSAVDLTIDALQFQLVVLDPRTKAEITSIPVTQFEWLNSAGNEFDPVQSIGPGSRSILGLGFQFSSGPDQYLHFDINYLGLDPVNSLVAKLDPAGCGAAGGRGKPVKA